MSEKKDFAALIAATLSFSTSVSSTKSAAAVLPQTSNRDISPKLLLARLGIKCKSNFQEYCTNLNQSYWRTFTEILWLSRKFCGKYLVQYLWKCSIWKSSIKEEKIFNNKGWKTALGSYINTNIFTLSYINTNIFAGNFRFSPEKKIILDVNKDYGV